MELGGSVRYLVARTLSKLLDMAIDPEDTGNLERYLEALGNSASKWKFPVLIKKKMLWLILRIIDEKIDIEDRIQLRKGAFIVKSLSKGGKWRPYLGIVGLSGECNFNCNYPFPEGDVNAFRVIEILDRIGVSSISFCCGEPLARREISELVRLCSEKGIKTNVHTNGKRLNTKLAEELRDAGLNEIEISLNNHRSSVHDAISKVPGSYDRALRAIKTSKEVGLTVKVSLTITSLNIGELMETIEFVEGLGVDGVNLYSYIPRNERDELFVPEIGRISSSGNPWSHKLDKIDLPWCRGCPALEQMIYVSPTGEVSPCPFLPTELGFEELSNLDWAELRKKFSYIEENSCKFCESFSSCGGCRARALSLRGDEAEIDPICPRSVELVQKAKGD